MFHEIYKYLKKENLLEQSYNKCNDSLKLLSEMFLYAQQVLRENRTVDQNYDIYLKDRIIDEHEREIRKKSLTHLAMSDMEDLNATLVLISIVHDIERIGDYTTNIYELKDKNPEKLDLGDFSNKITEIEKSINLVFTDLTKVDFAMIDKKNALMWMNALNLTRTDIDLIIDIITDTADQLTLSRKNIIVVILYCRYLKRISSHLFNIISSFVNPFDKIGSKEINNPN